MVAEVGDPGFPYTQSSILFPDHPEPSAALNTPGRGDTD